MEIGNWCLYHSTSFIFVQLQKWKWKYQCQTTLLFSWALIIWAYNGRIPCCCCCLCPTDVLYSSNLEIRKDWKTDLCTSEQIDNNRISNALLLLLLSKVPGCCCCPADVDVLCSEITGGMGTILARLPHSSYSVLIGREWSRDLGTGLSLVQGDVVCATRLCKCLNDSMQQSFFSEQLLL